MNRNENFQMLMNEMEKNARYKVAMREGLAKYQIKQYKISDMNPRKISEMYYLITTKFYYHRSPDSHSSWFENELKVFIYLLLGYSYLQQKSMPQMSPQDWQFFTNIFNGRSPLVLEFQALSIMKRNASPSKWCLKEVSLLDSIIKSKSIKNKWNEIAKELFIRSGKKFFKSPKQCREYWINHLDPQPVKSPWTLKEDRSLLEAMLKVGKKWAKVSQMMLGRRTEHMVKNRFKSLQNSQIKTGRGDHLKNQQVVKLLLQKISLIEQSDQQNEGKEEQFLKQSVPEERNIEHGQRIIQNEERVEKVSEYEGKYEAEEGIFDDRNFISKDKKQNMLFSLQDQSLISRIEEGISFYFASDSFICQEQ